MSNFNFAIAFLILCSVAEPAEAEYGCPTGYIPVTRGSGQQCVVDYNLPSWGQGASSTGRAAPRQRWRETWGAVVMDEQSRVSTTVGRATAKEAVDIAMRQCVDDAGVGCRLSLKYKNQCAVVAWPTKPLAKYVTLTGGSIEVIGAKALSKCATASKGVPCKLVYSGCSDSVRID